MWVVRWRWLLVVRYTGGGWYATLVVGCCCDGGWLFDPEDRSVGGKRGKGINAPRRGAPDACNL
ncbi:MAG: hypothetical protein WD491_02850 [Balneolales bacterium]